MKTMPLWAKIIALVLVFCLLACVVAWSYKFVKDKVYGDGGPDNSIFDKIFGTEPPTTDDTGPSDGTGISNDTDNKTAFGDKKEGTYVEYLMSNPSGKSDGLAFGFSNNDNGKASRLGFYIDNVKPGTSYCVSWNIDMTKWNTKIRNFYKDGKIAIAYNFNSDGSTYDDGNLLTADSQSAYANNEWYFTIPEKSTTLSIYFVECDYIGDDMEFAKFLADNFLSSISFSVSINEEAK